MEMKTAQTIDPALMSRPTETDDLGKEDICIEVKDLDLYYGEAQALKGIDMPIARQIAVRFPMGARSN